MTAEPTTDSEDPRVAPLVMAAAVAGLDLDHGDMARLLAALDSLPVPTTAVQLPTVGVLHRDEDETGVSGTGVVAWVVAFPDGVAVTRWAVTDVRQTCVWSSIDDVMAIHGHGGKTRIEWARDNATKPASEADRA